MGFASPLSRLRSTHGYTLAAAYAAHIKLLIPWVSLAPDALASPTAMLCRRLRGSYQTAYPVGFARARGARFTHGYALPPLCG
ncbi:MAG: hypothetical protein IKP00_05565, partial [Victivallales bacterium]|nr:hypothetical protein [Victivallales bacterium]